VFAWARQAGTREPQNPSLINVIRLSKVLSFPVA
jgi:hypothetical protein